jgi:hypothetical protein
MKKQILMLCGMLTLGVAVTQAQTIVASWENSLEGWTVTDPNWTSVGFSTTTGVTTGTYSWELSTTSETFGLDALTGPSSTALTALLINAASVSLDVDVPMQGSFGWWMQCDMWVNQPGGLGSVSLDNNCYCQYPPAGGGTAILNFPVPQSVILALGSHPSLPSYLTLRFNGGGAGTLYFDNLRVTPLGLINSWENSLEGWSVTDANWTSVGFSTTTGVTSGTYSWELSTTSETFAKDALTGPSSTALTSLLGNTASITLAVDVPTQGSFGWWMQCDMWANQPGGLGSVSLDGNCYCQYPPAGGGTAVLTFPVSQSVRSTLLGNASLPTFLTLRFNGGGAGTLYFDALQANLLPPAPAQLWVRETWDNDAAGLYPAFQSVTNNVSSVGFDPASPWITNPDESGGGKPTNTTLLSIRSFPEPDTMGLPSTLNGTICALNQDNGGGGHGLTTLWTAGDYMTRQLDPNNFINFQAEGEYWFAMTIGQVFDQQYSGDIPSAGAGGIGFADGISSNADFVAIGVTGTNVYLGPATTGNPFGTTNVTKTLYISQGTLGQPGNTNSLIYNPYNDPFYGPGAKDVWGNAICTQNGGPSLTNFTGGPFFVSAYATNKTTQVQGDSILVLGHLITHAGGNATLDAKTYIAANGDNLDLTTNGIVWDCSYAFQFGGTMTKMLAFVNGEFPFYIYAFRASTNFAEVVGMDPGYISVSPLANTFTGYPVNMTNYAAEAAVLSSTTLMGNVDYGTLTYQWYQNGSIIPNGTDQNFNIPSASTNDPSMPAGTDAGTYTCVVTDPSGTWAPVSPAPVVVNVTRLLPPVITGVQLFEDLSTIQVTFNEPNLLGADSTNNYVFNNGVTTTNAIVLNQASSTLVQLQTTAQPLGTRLTMTVGGISNVVDGIMTTTNEVFWTDLSSTGAVSWDAWLCPVSESDQAYFNTFLPNNPHPAILTNMTLTSWEGPTTGITLNGGNGAGSDFGGRMYGWFIPPVTTNYVFFISCDDGGRLSLSTNADPANLCVIAAESYWSATDHWTNYSVQYSTVDHRGDGTAANPLFFSTENYTNSDLAGYGWDDSAAAGSYVSGPGSAFVPNPATACQQNRSDQFIVAFYDSSGLPGGPAGATDQANWATAASQVTDVVPATMTNFWPKVDANGQALISLLAGQKYFMQFEHINNTGGYNESVTYKFAGAPDPFSGAGTTAAAATILTGSNIAALVSFTPTISIAQTGGGPLVTYTGVLLSGTNVTSITNQVAISSGGPSQYSPPHANSALFYRTGE